MLDNNFGISCQPLWLPPVGMVAPFAGVALPNGWLWCDGQAISRTTYADLFNALCPMVVPTFSVASPGVVNATGHPFREGDIVAFFTTGSLPPELTPASLYCVRNPTTNAFNVSTQPATALINFSGAGSGTHSCWGYGYGVGDGSTTFNVPDLRGRTLIGSGQGSGLTNRGKGWNVGAETLVIGTTNLPPHQHTVDVYNTYGNNNANVGGYAGSGAGNALAGGNGPGSSVAMNNIQPSVPINWIIRALRWGV